jgi:glyoxylate/hydroxypyruvate reductase
MSLLVCITSWDEAPWLARFRALLPGVPIVSMNEAYDPAAIRYAATWRAPHGLLARLPNLKAILNLGAGVDHLVADPALPNAPLVRVVDPDLTQRMTEWVVLQCLAQLRQVKRMSAAQAARHWDNRDDPPAAPRVRIGVMGVGVLGSDAARALKAVGFDVAGWSGSRRDLGAIPCFAGAAELEAFLARTDMLVVLLPLTAETRGMLNHALFRKLSRAEAIGGPVLINAGRGGLQVEADILAALDDGTLGAAVLDVFETEPLPKDSPLWLHPKVTITPHNSASSEPDAVAAYAARQYLRNEAGLPMENVVDLAKGY